MPTLALCFQATLLLYHQATTWLDLFPFNGVRFYSRGETIAEAGGNLVLMGLPLVGRLLDSPALLKYGVVYYFVLFAIECATWWGPYFLGASPKAAETYARIHAQTITVVPRRGANPAPNLEHLILMGLTLATAVTTFLAFRAAGPAFPRWWTGIPIGLLLATGTLYQFCWPRRPAGAEAAHPQD